ncbi:MAG: P-loop NTPase [Candidatus Aenigmarchaeota archaeon]|nr:P-loop NTPase [Candidatus Aenigmarchaeota archaeon]
MPESEFKGGAFEKAQERGQKIKEKLGKIKKKIAVYSGKGGVGKTMVAVNLAAALAKKGFSVGLLDADIDCPNVFRSLGLESKGAEVDENGDFEPEKKFGIKIVSVSPFQKSEEEATVWRGPLIAGALVQLVEHSKFGELDYLVIDLPPGTSDSPLTVMQVLQPDMFVIVTTPQKLAVLDAKRSANMVKRLGMKIAGVVDNMVSEEFGKDSRLTEELGVPLLASIPLKKEIREAADNGIPAVLEDKELALLFSNIVEKII